MKKTVRIAISALTLILIICALCSCNEKKVVFDIGDAALVHGQTEFIYEDGSLILPPVIEKEGYVFDGWDKDFSVITEDTVIKPKWKKIHTVFFRLVGGEADDKSLLTQEVIDGMSAEAPTPTRDRYDFVGWDTDFSEVTEDLTVNAIWERKTFTSTEIYNIVNPATVEIKTYRQNGIFFSMGSGFFINENGTLITNYHVIKDAPVITAITADGAEYIVTEVTAYDIKKDIAVLRIHGADQKFPYLEISNELPNVGEAVWAIGSSLGLTGTFSSGIISYVNRDIDGVKFIQTTTPISSGNSGGPLVNEHGYVIGINSASYTEGQNLNLAIEISQYQGIARVNLDPEDLFYIEATLLFWFGEKPVMQTESSKTTGQLLRNGDTVLGHHDGDGGIAHYMLAYPNETAIMLVMIAADNTAALTDISAYISAFAIGQNKDGEMTPLPSEFIITLGIFEDPDGGMYYTAMVAAPAELIGIAESIGISISSDTPADYAVFLYYITEEMADSLS